MREKGILETFDTGLNIDFDVAPVKLTDRFGVPPFSILDARQGYWQTRKNLWLKLGIQSELGRGANLLKFSEQATISTGGGKAPAKSYQHQRASPYSNNKEIATQVEYYRMDKAKKKYAECLRTNIGEEYGRKEMSATSIFDPVICELAYRWFSPPGGWVLDPFSGGSVRGIVASILGRKYVGIDLSEAQVSANYEQWEKIEGRKFAQGLTPPIWISGDSREVRSHMERNSLSGVRFDFIFSCPPYGNLEVYSDDPNDLSTLSYDIFIQSYGHIIQESCNLLRQDRFACFVVGDFRGPEGYYRGFPTDTVIAFEDAGLRLYNEGILVTAVGSLPVRINKQFTKNRKLGKTHQNVFVFHKGEVENIRESFSEEV